MQEVDFFKLPRAVQDRIVGGMRGEFPPSPLARLAARRLVPWPWLTLSAVGGVTLLVLLSLGYGTLAPRGQQGMGFLLGYVLAAFALAFGALGAVAALVRATLLPFPRGTFLYATRILFTERHPIRTVTLDPAAQVEVVPAGLSVKLPQGSYLFACDAMQASAAMGAIAAVVASRAEKPADNEFVDEQDPLHQPRFNSPFGESEALRQTIPGWIRFAWVTGLALAAVMGGSAFLLRNRKSDTRMFQVAREANTVAAYTAYLQYGKNHKAEVVRTHLPRAELREAMQIGTPEAILAFESAHPGIAIGKEVQDAKRAALLAELARRERAGQLNAVRAFPKDFPGSGLEGEVGVAVGRLYRQVAEKVQGKSPEAALMLSSALTFAETHGPAAQIVWENKPSKNIPNLEKVLVRVPEYMGDMDKPSTHFQEKALAERAARFAEEFAREVSAVIPPEYLEFKLTPAPGAALPTVHVSEQLEWSGYTLRSKKPRGVYVGLQFLYDVKMSVPGSQRPYRQQVTVGRRVTDAMLKEYEKNEAGSYEGKLYESMQNDAHAELKKKLTGALLH